MDSTDRRIVEELSACGRITMKELGKKVHLTGQAAAARVLKLEAEGFIEGYTVRINELKMGYNVHCFINIYTKGMEHTDYLSFLKEHPSNVIHNFKISGEGCYLLECRFHSPADLNSFLNELNQLANYKLSIVIDR
ncbi:Lrp/AsnC family transcriptional regulator [Heyndrickxia acidicola]|uniref:Lrp/AsnC family transcriptional regulator n=1 Tax=Heyndrickxia acidicola TaxID=209389 RepID=A0ABU6MIC2_9BACI|nr:Lrp/AsnC family transcriptional regulator [Heyndrickxia acidicola]MED1204431.1 Lrp/AsnC family transcriptional regulator [Heyndrickxia acidicola]